MNGLLVFDIIMSCIVALALLIAVFTVVSCLLAEYQELERLRHERVYAVYRDTPSGTGPIPAHLVATNRRDRPTWGSRDAG